MKKFAVLITFVIASLFLSACVPTAMSTIELGPDFSGNKGDYELEFTQLHNDVLSSFEGENPFVYVTGLDIGGNNGERKITVNATVMPGITEEDAGYFMAAVARYLGDAASVQDSRITGTDSRSFGNLFTIYSLSARVADEEGTEIVSLEVPAGEEVPLDPDIEKYYAEWEKAMEIYQRNNQ